MNQRVRELRKTLKMTQKEFANALGITQSAVSWMEIGGNSVTDQTVKAICTIFNVSENWLRTGELPVFTQPNTFSLDRFIEERNGTKLEVEIIKTYFELDPEIRKAILSHFKEKFAPAPHNDLFADIPETAEELEKMYPPIDIPTGNEEAG